MIELQQCRIFGKKIMRLNTLLQDLKLELPELNCEVNNLTADSRSVTPGDLFFAYPGIRVDGRKFIDEALQNGAGVIVCEQAVVVKLHEIRDGVHFIYLQNVLQKIGIIASAFQQYPSATMNMIGITGSNGKTSTCQMIAGCLHGRGHPAGIIGTIGNGIYGNLVAVSHTTALPIATQQLLNDFVQRGVKTVAMEVSSHGLEQGRVNGIEFDLAIFTNLTREHLDYHQTMEKYFVAKRKLFQMPGLRQAIINLDDERGVRLAHEFAGKLKILGYGLQKNQHIDIPMVYASNIKQDYAGITAEIHTPWGSSILQTTLLGRFNLSNCLAVLAALCMQGMELEQAINRIIKLPHVIGRMQLFGSEKCPRVIIDYAHSPDALEKALTAINEHFQHKICCVFGCGGDRDRGKRPMMARIAEQAADYVVLCDDNPRSEDPQQIINDMVKGLQQPDKVTIIHDRAQAIKHAINQANKNDVILIAGKGHEDYQIINDKRIHYSDAEQVNKYLKLLPKPKQP